MSANVNKPTDVKQKEADINRKLQVYGIFSAFKQGKVPSVCCIPIEIKGACKSLLTFFFSFFSSPERPNRRGSQ